MNKKKIKILYFYITHPLEGFQGFNIHIKEFIEHANNIDGVEVIGCRPLAVSRKKTAFYFNLYHKIRSIIPRFGKDILAILSNIIDYFHARKLVQTHKPDVILFRHNHMNFYQNILKKKYKLPLILEVNAPMTQERIDLKEIALRRISFFLEKWSWQTADKIYVVSQALKKILANFIEPKRIVAIHNGVNEKLYKNIKRKKENDQNTIIGFVGSFRKYHGIDILYPVMLKVLQQSTNVTFLLIGSGGSYPQLKSSLEKNKSLKKQILLPGHIVYEQLPHYITQMDITLMMDFTEYGSPLKIFEYMIAKTCIIVPDRAPIREVLQDEEEALFFKPRDMESFEKCIKRALSDRTLRERLSKNAYKKVVNNYTWTHNANKIIHIAKSLNKSYV